MSGQHTLNDGTVLYNFGKASGLDDVLHGAVRPGPSAGEGRVSLAEVREWADYMKAQGIRRVVGLLGPAELKDFEKVPVEALSELGMRAINVPLEGVADLKAAMKEIEAEFRDAEAAGEKVVVHCWGGSGRTGKVLASWLVLRHGLSVADAAAEVERFAASLGTNRRANVKGVAELAGP